MEMRLYTSFPSHSYPSVRSFPSCLHFLPAFLSFLFTSLVLPLTILSLALSSPLPSFLSRSHTSLLWIFISFFPSKPFKVDNPMSLQWTLVKQTRILFTFVLFVFNDMEGEVRWEKLMFTLKVLLDIFFSRYCLFFSVLQTDTEVFHSMLLTRRKCSSWSGNDGRDRGKSHPVQIHMFFYHAFLSWLLLMRCGLYMTTFLNYCTFGCWHSACYFHFVFLSTLFSRSSFRILPCTLYFASR